MGIGLFLGPVVMTLLLLRGAEAGPSPQPSVAVSNFNRAVAAIQGSPASSSCQLQLFAQATYKPGSTTVAGTLTVTNPTSAAINVRHASDELTQQAMQLRPRLQQNIVIAASQD